MTALALATAAFLAAPGTEASGSDFVETFVPESIHVDHKRNLRWSADGSAKSHEQSDITALAHSIVEASGRYDETQPATALIKIPVDSDNPEAGEREVLNFRTGQQAPGGYHYEADPADPTRKIKVLRYGFGRYEAVLMINTQPALFAEELKTRLGITPADIEDGNFIFPFAAKDRSGIDPMMDNVMENGSRVHLSDMDWARMVEAIRYSQGRETPLSTAQIAAKLAPLKPVKDGAPSPSWVDQHLELLKCSPKLQALVHRGANNGGISVFAALQIRRNADKVIKAVPQEERGDDAKQVEDAFAEMDRVIDTMTDNEGNFDAKAGRASTRAKAAELGAKTTKTVTEVKGILRPFCEEGGPGSIIASTLLGWIESEVSDEKLISMLEREKVDNVKPGSVKAWRERQAAAAEKAAAEKRAAAEAAGAKKTPPKVEQVAAGLADGSIKPAAEGGKKGGKKGQKTEGADPTKTVPAGTQTGGKKPGSKSGGRTSAAEAEAAAQIEAPASE